MSAHLPLWFVHASAKSGGETVNLAVAAFTERSARVQARKRLGPGFAIDGVNPVRYAHAWVLNHSWRPRESEAKAEGRA